MTVLLRSSPVTAQQIAAVAGGEKVELSAEAVGVISESRAIIEAAIRRGDAVYGLNRRLGAGRDVEVSETDFADFQRRILANHLGGIGAPIAEPAVRAIIFTRLAGFALGGSGVRPALAAAYAALLNSQVYPLVRARGSVGAADLTQLAAIAAVATGQGRAFVAGKLVSGGEALVAAGLEPIELAAHEGLAVLSSNAFSLSSAALQLGPLFGAARAADLSAALSLEAIGLHSSGGNLSPFDPVVQHAHAHSGQTASAATVRELLDGSYLATRADRVSVQDRLSFRTAPQVNGALREAITSLDRALALELSARTDNPLVDIESRRIISGGNFAITSFAMAVEALKIGIAHVGIASERRTALLSDLSAPFRAAGRTRVPGLLLYASSAGVAELKQFAQPATLDSTVLSGDVEDVSSLAPLALERSAAALERLNEILAIEAIHAAQLISLARAEGTEFSLGGGSGPVQAKIAALIESASDADDLVQQTIDAIAQ